MAPDLLRDLGQLVSDFLKTDAGVLGAFILLALLFLMMLPGARGRR